MKMINQLFTTTLLLSLLLVGCTSKKPSQSHTSLSSHTLNWDDVERSYLTYIPKELTSQVNVPVLFVLHGGGGTAEGMPRFTEYRFNELAVQEKFIVVYPQGVGKQWNDGRDKEIYPPLAKQDAWAKDIDDVGFLVQILENLKAQYSIDEDRVFSCGISNGGFMTNRLLCERSDIFKGGGIVTATSDIHYFKSCTPSEPVGVIILNGTADASVPYEGGDLMVFNIKRGEVLGTEEYAAAWADKNSCKQGIWSELPDTQDDGTTVSKLTYAKGNEGKLVTLYKIEGGGHTWPGARAPLYEKIAGTTSMDINACDVIWDFFKSL